MYASSPPGGYVRRRTRPASRPAPRAGSLRAVRQRGSGRRFECNAHDWVNEGAADHESLFQVVAVQQAVHGSHVARLMFAAGAVADAVFAAACSARAARSALSGCVRAQAGMLAPRPCHASSTTGFLVPTEGAHIRCSMRVVPAAVRYSRPRSSASNSWLRE